MKNKLVLMFFVILSIHVECIKISKRVINGEDAPSDTYPWAISIKGNSPVSYGSMGVCGASLINDQWLVTAAHCFYVMNKNQEFVANLDVKNWHLQAGNTIIDLSYNTDDEETKHEDDSLPQYPPTKPSIVNPRPRPTPRPPIMEYYTRRYNYNGFKDFDRYFNNDYDSDFNSMKNEMNDLRNRLKNLFKEYGFGARYYKKRHIKRVLDTMADQVKRKTRQMTKRGERQHLHISKIIVHPKYDPSNIEWDIALIKLNKPIHYKHLSGINPVDLPPANTGVHWPLNGQECVLVGWGCQKAGGSAVEKAQLARLNVMPNSRCSVLYSYKAGLNSQHEFCAGFYNKGHGICPGDSGSGLVCKEGDKWVLAGVTSATHMRNPKDYPGIFTRVSYFRKWIDEELALDGQ